MSVEKTQLTDDWSDAEPRGGVSPQRSGVISPFHAKYFAYDLTRQAPPGAADQLSMSLFDASVDLNPHQIEAAMFALQSPLSEGVILADEVGLGRKLINRVGFSVLA
nr:hypothetical protein [Rhodothalassium salexigens]